MKKSQKEFIIATHSDPQVCVEWKEKIEANFKELFDWPLGEVKKGSYVKVIQEGHPQEGDVVVVSAINKGHWSPFVIDTNKISGEDGDCYQKTGVRLASNLEIEEALTQEAAIRDFKGIPIGTWCQRDEYYPEYLVYNGGLKTYGFNLCGIWGDDYDFSSTTYRVKPISTVKVFKLLKEEAEKRYELNFNKFFIHGKNASIKFYGNIGGEYISDDILLFDKGKWLPIEKTKPEANKWYSLGTNFKFRFNSKGLFKDTNYGFDGLGNWADELGCHDDDDLFIIKEMSKEQVFQKLKNEAINRNFPYDGTYVYSTSNKGKDEDLICNRINIYSNGKWLKLLK